ncbi:helix-turn-helix domain-containing protein [Streptomyces scopuliridis]|uniref:Helix-turn-helix domain-containing protein n=1 Tax=Streptomyces scopuliridis TaxID=452529 RepID=A0ACD4ZKN2_9ACTN|nr:helix-turn-helix transcriptional regulator [Streptomyces scopuliridis]WSB98918.1 helix-turn-helix domain-containing protein [Streptomyces scopuliridis]WSC07380.1 helix-turn-helix domain-containing protein [Streptomyces scopuliridis]
MSEPRSAPTIGQLVLSKQLQGLRERAGLSRDRAAKLLHVAPATIRRMEMAEVALKVPYVQLLLPAYGVTGDEGTAFLQLVDEANKPGWWQRFHDVLPDWFGGHVSLEEAAKTIRCYEPHFVPGLLQTEDYARAILTYGEVGRNDPARIERHVALRLERQSLLTRPDAPVFWVVMDETVLHRPVGSSAVMRAQIDRLLAAAELPNVTLQIAEFAAGHHPGTYSPFVLFRFAIPELPDMVIVEYLTGALYIDNTGEVAEHMEAMDRMVAHAESARRTKQILADFRKEL